MPQKTKEGEKEKKEDYTGFENEVFMVHKQITFLQSPYIYNISHYGIYIYVLRSLTTQVGFLYISKKFLPVGKTFNKYQLEFINHSVTEDLSLVITKDYVRKALRESKVSINLCSLWTHKYKEYANPFKVHLNVVAFDKKEWWLEGLPKSKGHAFLSRYLKKTKLDSRLLNILKSMLVNSQRLPMYLQTHSLVLTNGKTGKSSYLGSLGKNLDITSDAGIFGYYNTASGQWRGGILTTTKDPIIIDEINELISKKARILDTLNKPLENGSFYYGKAGSQEIRFNNMFILLGNIDNQSNFDSIITGISLNPATIGRRFCYLVYDDSMVLKKRDYSLITKPSYTQKLSIYYGEIFDKYQKSILKAMQSNRVLTASNTFKAKMLNRIMNLELNNSIQFLKEYLSSSIFTRLWVMASKIAIFDLADKIKCTSHLIDKSYIIYLELLRDIENSIENIIKHFEAIEIEPYNYIGQYFENASKYVRNAVIICWKNRDRFKNRNCLVNENLKGTKEELRRYKLFLLDLKRHYLNQNQKLNVFGLHSNIVNKQVVMRILTKSSRFEEICRYLDNNYKEVN